MELTEEEFQWFETEAKKKIPRGISEDSEQTFLEIYSMKEILDNQFCDWATMGQILSVVTKIFS
jgi:hypothetical protein